MSPILLLNSDSLCILENKPFGRIKTSLSINQLLVVQSIPGAKDGKKRGRLLCASKDSD